MPNDNVYDLSQERDRKEVEEFAKGIADFQGFKIDLDLTGVSVAFTGYAFGKEDPKKSQLRIIAYDTSGPSVRPMGAVRMEQRQWVKFVEKGNVLLDPHAIPPTEFPKYLVQIGDKDKFLSLHELERACQPGLPKLQVVAIVLEDTFDTRVMTQEEEQKVYDLIEAHNAR